MDKVYDQTKIEAKWYKLWEEKGFFKPEINPEGKPYTIILPPPNANAPLHFGHAMFVIEDILIRYHRMLGKAALWLPGSDHAGFETQVVFEKQLEKEGKSRFDFDRSTLYQMIWDFVQNNKGTMEGQVRRLGFSVDWSREKFTLDPDIIKVVYKTFKKMFDEGLAYRGLRLVNYCTKHGTSFSDLEVFYEDRTTPLYYIKYGPLTLATVRLETKFGDTAVAVHPMDKRYQKYIGQIIDIETVLGPAKIKVIADSAVDPEFGTGVIKVTPAHSMMDFEIGQRHNLEIRQVIGFDGRMNEKAGKFAGMRVKEARAAIAKEMQEKGLIVSVDENYQNRVGVCYKCGTEIEPLPMEQWFIKVGPLAKKAIGVAKKGEIKIYPKNWESTYFHWLEKLKDWNISRQIVWGMQIPAWYCGRSENMPKMGFDENVVSQILQGKTKTYRLRNHYLKIGDKVVFENTQEKKVFGFGVITNIERKKIGEIDLDDKAHGKTYKTYPELITAFRKHYPPDTKIDKATGAIIYSYTFEPILSQLGCNRWIVTEGEAPTKCPNCGNASLKRDADVFDTWFSSGQWPFATLQTTKEGDFEKFYPTTIMETMYDILPFWVIRMVMLGIYSTGKIPFADIVLHGKVLDPQGKKMSKSKGNVVDPIDIANQYGADALRMALVYGTAFGHDQALSHPKLQAMRNFTNKLWNIGRFIIDFAPEDAKHLEPNTEIASLVARNDNKEDTQILDKLSQTVEVVSKAIDSYRFHDGADALYEFIWHEFADKYIESTKNRRAQAQPILEYVFKTSLELLHPFMPYITEELWQKLPHSGDSVMISNWPEAKLNAN